MWSNSEYIWPNAQRNWPNACTFNQLRSHLATVGRVDQMRSAFGQMRAHLVTCARISSNAARFVNWSDAQRICPNALSIWPNAQIGQMHLTLHEHFEFAEIWFWITSYSLMVTELTSRWFWRTQYYLLLLTLKLTNYWRFLAVVLLILH